MSNLPNRLEEVLGEEIYKREDEQVVDEILAKLSVKPSDTFRNFYKRYEGPFWEENVPFELLDIVAEENNIEVYTTISRKEHDFPNNYLVLSEMSANAVIVLDTSTDNVYIVNFEGGDELLLKGDLEPSWKSFYDFLKAYFNC